MQEAANEALLAMGNCSPNPPVGAIIVSKDNKKLVNSDQK